MILFPHAAYAEAVHLALHAAGVGPTSTTVRIMDPDGSTRGMLIAVDWCGDHPALNSRVWPHGMRLVWRPVHGWYADDAVTLLSRSLPIPVVAGPDALVATIAEIRATGLFEDGDPLDLPGSDSIWDCAPTLGVTLSDREEQ